MKKYFSLICALCIVAGVSSCAETEPSSTEVSTVSCPAETTVADTATAVSSENEITFKTTTTSLEADENGLVFMTTEGYTETTTSICSLPTAPDKEPIETDISEQFTPAYDPGQPDIYLNILNTEIYTDTEEIEVTINCNSACGTGLGLELASNKNGEWVIHPCNINYDSWAEITPDSPLTETLRFSDYNVTLEYGVEYRISKTINDKQYEIYFSPSEYNAPLKESDISVTIDGGNIVALGTEKLILNYEYVGNADFAEYGFGCEYYLEKEVNGKWEKFPFSGEASFIELAYLIGTESKYNSTSVSLSDNFYANPLTVGKYRIIKNIHDITYKIEFELVESTPETSNDYIEITIRDGNIINYPTDTITLDFQYIGSDKSFEKEFGSYFFIEKLGSNGEWKKFDFGGVVEFTDEAYLLGYDFPKNSTTVPLNEAIYKEPFSTGEYRIVKDIEGEKYYIPFTYIGMYDLSYENPPEFEKEFVTVSIDGDNVFTTEDKSFRLIYKYNEDAPLGVYEFSHGFKLEKQNENGKWTKIKLNPDFITCDCIPSIGTIYPEFSEEIHLKNEADNPRYEEELTAGKYRLTKTISGIDYILDFEIASPEPEIYDENGSITLTIDEISADGFICSMVWPYPAVYNVECNPDEYDNFCVGDNIEVYYDVMYQLGEWEYLISPESIEISDFELEPDVAYKPVIYLYPEEETEVSVKLDYNGKLTVTYPEYGNGWNVTAMPDGTLFDSEGNEYSYLFWEGESNTEYDFSKGFCVRGEDTADFLRYALSTLGLTPREYNEFIVFWLPLMKDNPYNIISFQTDRYTDNAILTVTPEPDTVLRVFMAFKPSSKPVKIEEQKLETIVRNGFTVVEWGGTKINR